MNRGDEPIEIRVIGEEKIDDLLEVYRACEDFLALGPDPIPSLEMIRKDLAGSRDEGGKYCGIFLRGETIVGVFDYSPRNYHGQEATAYISLLMLKKAFRNQGIGSRVMEWMESEIREDPEVTRILAGVQVNNPQAIEFWKNQGFQIVSGPERCDDQTTVYRLEKKIRESG